MELGLSGRTAIVTGGGGGIGLAIVHALIAEGAFVVVGSRSTSPELDALIDKEQVRFVAVDLSTADGPAELVSYAGSTVDILVNNVGSAPARTGGFLSVTDEMWLATLTINLLAAVRATRAVLPLMLAAGSGSVVTVSSINATLADPAVVDYSAAKAALSNFSKSLSKEYGGRGIRFNTVRPGPVSTDLWLGKGGVAETLAAASGHTPEEVAARAAAGIPSGRFSRPQEVADAVVFLASDRSANTTGAEIVLDGGMVDTW
ncbi:SDR family oxidoreductase [Acidothermaceae bacterium B102]|nr:SDR family oxidoreductase [Acidothermaceae bacterium B102]